MKRKDRKQNKREGVLGGTLYTAMNIVVWNVRGLNDPDKQEHIDS